MRLYILDALRNESRVEKILDLTVGQSSDRRERDVVLVTLRVQPVGGAGPVSVGPLGLELRA